MPDQTAPLVQGFNVADEATLRANLAAFKDAVSVTVEQAGATFRALGEQLRAADGHRGEEWRQVGDDVRAMADGVAALGIGSFVKAAADAETKRVYRAREETDRG